MVVCKQRTIFIILENIEYLILAFGMNALHMYSLSNKQTACRDSLPSITISSATIYVIQLLEKNNTNTICIKYYNQLLLLQG